MEIAVVLYEGMTALDAVGPYEVLARLPGARLTSVGHSTGEVRTDTRALGLTVDVAFEDLPRPDVVLVPGGPGQTTQMDDERFLDWLRTAHETSTWTTSVCTGSLLLAVAGLLEGRRATSHWLALEQLRAFGVEPVRSRTVVDGKIVTAAGVSAGIDMALELAGLVAGPEVAQAIQLGIEYDPQPPFPAGSPDTAPEPIVTFLRSQSRWAGDLAT